MEDKELEEIRKQRLSQMKSQYGDGNSDAENAQKEMARQQEAKHMILAQIMDQESRGRLNTLRISKPEKADMVEGIIIRMAQTGQIAGKISDSQLISLLESVNSQMPNKSQVKFDRRRAAIDSDDENFDF